MEVRDIYGPGLLCLAVSYRYLSCGAPQCCVYTSLKYNGTEKLSGVSGNLKPRDELAEQIFQTITESETGITRHTLMKRFGVGKEIGEALAILRKDGRIKLVRGF